MPRWADAINSFIRQDYKPYYGKDTLLGDGSHKSGARNVTGGIRKPTDDFDKLLQRINRPMPARGSKRGRMAPSRRSTKRKAPRGKKYKRKAPIRKSTKRKKRKVSKSIGLTTGTIRQRHVEHIQYAATAGDALYVPMNSIGPKDEMLKIVAQSLMLHYMHRCGDYRSNVTSAVHTNGSVASEPYMSATWETMKFLFTLPSDGSLASATISSETKSLEALATELAVTLLAQLKLGRRLATVLVYRSSNECIFSDVSAGRNVIEFSVKSLIKMQNTTIADTPQAAVDSCGKDNAMNINRNPLDGLVYNFKNAVPKFKQQFLIGKAAGVRQSLDNVHDCYSTALTGVYAGDATGGLAWASLADAKEFEIPPPSPSTMFSNSAGKKFTSISPGGHNSYGLSEYCSAPINSFFDRYFPVQDTTVPPGGSCIIIALKPKYRNTSDAAVTVQAEVDHTYGARVSRAKMTALPMNTVYT